MKVRTMTTRVEFAGTAPALFRTSMAEGMMFRKRTLSIDSEADGPAALGEFGSGLVDVDGEVGLVEEGVGEDGGAESSDGGIVCHRGVGAMVRCKVVFGSVFRVRGRGLF